MRITKPNRFFYTTLFVFVLMFSGTLFAQTEGVTSESRGGSIYSSIGVGYPVDVTSAGLKSQGIFGLTNVNRETSGLANPALWGDTYFTLASTGLSLASINADNGITTNKNTNLESGYLHLLFPVKPGKFGISFGLYPSTRANLRAINSDEIRGGSIDSAITYTNEIQSYGGVNKFEIGFGLKLTKSIAIGYAPSIAFLILEKTENFSFNGGGFNSHSHTFKLSGTTFAQRFGITGTFSGLLRESDRLSVGGTLNLPIKIQADERFTSVKNVEGSAQEVEITEELDISEGEVQIPLEAAFGVGYAPSRLVNFSVEGQLQKWGDYQNELQPGSELLMKDRFKIGMGGQFHPHRTNSDAFFSGFKYSAGVSYDTGHLSIEQEDISTLWLNTGIGIPSRNASFIDISLQYGFRGTTNNNLIQEQIWALSFSVNLTEQMFIRPKLR